MTREAPPLLGSFDPFGDGSEPWTIRWIADSAGVWLQVDDNYGNQGPLSMREVEGMSSFNPDELEVSHVDGVGYRYGLPGGKPILPFPFTAVQLFEFDQRQGGLVRGNFYIRAEEAEAQLTKLEQTDPEAAELARIIFSGVMPVQQATITDPAPLVAACASDGLQPDRDRPAKPLQRTAAQDSAILCEIEKRGYDPLALPKNPPGKPGAKAAIRAALSENSLFTGGTVFDKAWERLTARAEIVIQG